MKNWISLDKTGLHINIPPVPDDATIILLLAACALAIFLLLAGLKAWPNYRNKVSDLLAHRFSEKTALNRVGWFAILLSPVWLILLIASIVMLAMILWSFPDVFLADRTATTSDGTSNLIHLRWHAIAFVTLLTALAGLIATPLSILRTFTTERQTKTAEQNLITDLINTAVAGLGTEKTVSRIGHSVTFDDHQTKIEWQDEPLTTGKRTKTGDWQTFTSTKPNFEVRIGAIHTLERIALDNPPEHVRVMKILCAYIRENAKAEDTQNHDLGDWPDYPKNPTKKTLENRNALLNDRKSKLRQWAKNLEKPRTDIQTALEVIGKRSPDHIDREETREGYKLDLRNTNLQHAVLSSLNLSSALLSGARMEGANLRGADMRSAEWAGAHLASPAHSADLRGAKSLSQSQFDQMIGNTQTLLPDTPDPDTGNPCSIPSCWTSPPANFDLILKTAAGRFASEDDLDKLRAEFLCQPGQEPKPTGTPLALNSPYPPGHPLDPA